MSCFAAILVYACFLQKVVIQENAACRRLKAFYRYVLLPRLCNLTMVYVEQHLTSPESAKCYNIGIYQLIYIYVNDQQFLKKVENTAEGCTLCMSRSILPSVCEVSILFHFTFLQLETICLFHSLSHNSVDIFGRAHRPSVHTEEEKYLKTK